MVHFFKIPEWFIWTSFAVTFAACLWKGSWQARAIVGSQLAQMIYQRTWICLSDVCLGGLKDERLWQYLAQDALLTGIAIAGGLTSRRYWILGAASIGLCALSTDLLAAYTEVITPWGMKWAGYIWTYTVLLLCLGEVGANVRDERAAGRLGRQALAA